MDVNKIIAERELGFIGGGREAAKVMRFRSGDEGRKIDILRVCDKPWEGVQVCGTVGLSGVDIGLVSDNLPLRVEILGACDINVKCFGEIISGAAFEIMAQRRCFPGLVLTDIMGRYLSGCEMRHLLLTDPFLWEEAKSIRLSGMHVAWLLAVPVSESEYRYACTHGSDLLEDIFEREDIDIFDPGRESVL